MSHNGELPPLVADGQEEIVPDEGYSEHPLSAMGRRTMAVPRSVAARKVSATNSTLHALAAASMNVDVDDRISTNNSEQMHTFTNYASQASSYNSCEACRRLRSKISSTPCIPYYISASLIDYHKKSV